MDLKEQMRILEEKMHKLESDYYSNNFQGSQDFSKYVRFNSRLKIPSYTTLPSVCEVGELVESGGVVKVCSATNTWTTVGTQT